MKAVHPPFFFVNSKLLGVEKVKKIETIPLQIDTFGPH